MEHGPTTRSSFVDFAGGGTRLVQRRRRHPHASHKPTGLRILGGGALHPGATRGPNVAFAPVTSGEPASIHPDFPQGATHTMGPVVASIAVPLAAAQCTGVGGTVSRLAGALGATKPLAASAWCKESSVSNPQAHAIIHTQADDPLVRLRGNRVLERGSSGRPLSFDGARPGALTIAPRSALATRPWRDKRGGCAWGPRARPPDGKAQQLTPPRGVGAYLVHEHARSSMHALTPCHHLPPPLPSPSPCSLPWAWPSPYPLLLPSPLLSLWQRRAPLRSPLGPR